MDIGGAKMSPLLPPITIGLDDPVDLVLDFEALAPVPSRKYVEKVSVE